MDRNSWNYQDWLLKAGNDLKAAERVGVRGRVVGVVPAPDVKRYS